LGARLRDARQKAGRTTSDVATDTGLPERYVVALEEGDMSAMPDLSYARLYLQSYARLLDLDSEAMLQAWPSARPSEPERPALRTPGMEWRKAVWIGAAVLVLVGVVGFGLFRSRFESGPAGHEQARPATLAEQPPATAPEAGWAVDSTAEFASEQASPSEGPLLQVPAATLESPPAFAVSPGGDAAADEPPSIPANEAGRTQVTSQPTPVSPFQDDLPAVLPAPPRTLTVKVAAQTWLVIEADGDTVVARVVARGETVSTQVASEYRLTVANARDLEVTLDGQPVVLGVRSDRPLIRHPIVGKDST
jgi:cytoskeleton protein RodZ